MRLFFNAPLNPLSHTFYGRSVAAACDVFERVTRRYGKPEFNIKSTMVNGKPVAVREKVVWRRPFCNLLQFEKDVPRPDRSPKLLIVAPLSGHHATLLRDTVEAMLPHHDVYITDWTDARTVPLAEGSFDLDDCIDYLISIFRMFRGECHVMAVCQPSVPVLAAIALMEEARDPHVPFSMVLVGGPIDTRVNPTAVNGFAEQRGTQWFRRNVITRVPFPHRGFLRAVYPGILQLSGFVGMNLDRHLNAHQDFFFDLVRGDRDSAEKHRRFYDMYFAVMDLTAEFFLQTIDTVFVHHRLAKGEMVHRGQRVRPAAIRHVALMTVEGEGDDICGVGQTQAAHILCANLPEQRAHHLQPGVGHFGLFSGSRFREEIRPRITDFLVNAQAASFPRLNCTDGRALAARHG
jgi:poly(3-hydroxybutyrate) depolymerase